MPAPFETPVTTMWRGFRRFHINNSADAAPVSVRHNCCCCKCFHVKHAPPPRIKWRYIPREKKVWTGSGRPSTASTLVYYSGNEISS